jgi:hypothetical protein
MSGPMGQITGKKKTQKTIYNTYINVNVTNLNNNKTDI